MNTNQELKEQYMDEKKKIFEDGCRDRKDPVACYSLGEWYQLMGRDLKKASEIFDQTCFDMKHYNACFNLAALYITSSKKISTSENSLPISKSKDLNEIDNARQRAVYLTHMSCKYGSNIQACATYASLLLSERIDETRKEVTELSPEKKEAMDLLEKMCIDERDVDSCARVATLYANGARLGVPKIMSKAFEFSKRACDSGNPQGCHTLSVMYRLGDGVGKDEEKSEQYKAQTLKMVQERGAQMGAKVVGV